MPLPDEPAFSRPALAWASKSLKSLIGLVAGTTTSIGEPASSATGFRSRWKSYGALPLNSVTLAACVKVMASRL